MKKMRMSVLVLVAVMCAASGCGNSAVTDEKTEPDNTAQAATPDTVAAESEPEPEADDVGKMAVTQFMVVEVTEFGPCFRGDMSNRLKNLGFDVKMYDNPDPDGDEMASYVIMKAVRKSPAGTTMLTMRNGEDVTLTLDFATEQECDRFIESMEKSGYSREGTLYMHPACNMAKIGARVKGPKRIVMMYPFEMFPTDF